MVLSNANAQEVPALPIDPQVRIGQLDNGVDLIEGFEQTLESISTDDVKSIVKEVLSQGNNVKVIMVGTAE